MASVADLPVAAVIDRVLLDEDGRVEDIVTEYCNHEATALFGLAAVVADDGRLGLSITETLPAKAAAESLNVADRIWSTGQSARGTWRLDGQHPLALTYTRVRMEPCYLLGYFEPTSAIEAEEATSRDLPGLAEALEASPDGFLIVDTSLSRPYAPVVVVHFVNPAGQALIGDLASDRELDAATPFGRLVLDLLNQSAGIDAVVSGDWTLRVHGQSRTLTVSTKPLTDGRRVITFRDTTLKAQLEESALASAAEAQESRALLYTALDSLPMPVGVCELAKGEDDVPSFVLRFRNAEALRRSADAPAGPGVPLAQAMPGLASAGLARAMLLVLRTGEPGRWSGRLDGPGGDTIDYEIVISRVSENTVIIIGFDVTEERQIQEDLAAARDAALSYAEERTEFFSALTHELRTPLTTVVGAGELMLDTHLDPSQRSLAEGQLAASRHLLRVINDSLDMRSLGQGALLADTDFQIDHVVASVEAIATTLASAAGTSLAFAVGRSVPAALRGDALGLERALLNLVSNAVKFSPGGEVRVHIDAERVRGDEWELLVEVADNGIGIEPGQLDAIFLPFHQGSPDIRRTHGGSGLGLALVKETVERMNGRVWAESEPGGGAVFRFTVRLHAPATVDAVQDSADHATSSERFASARVLLVEDEDVNRILVTALLEREGLVVDSVDNGLDAVAAAVTGLYDLVFMDVRMPVVSGFEAAQRIRRSMTADRLPIVALTASPTAEVRAKAREAGMQETLGKPIDVLEVLAAVSRLVPAQGADVPTRP